MSWFAFQLPHAGNHQATIAIDVRHWHSFERLPPTSVTILLAVRGELLKPLFRADGRLVPTPYRARRRLNFTGAALGEPFHVLNILPDVAFQNTHHVHYSGDFHPWWRPLRTSGGT